jgi:hypothetical protein
MACFPPDLSHRKPKRGFVLGNHYAGHLFHGARVDCCTALHGATAPSLTGFRDQPDFF